MKYCRSIENIIIYITYIDAPGTRISSPLIGSEHEFKTKDSVGWYDLYAHQFGVNKHWVARRKRDANRGGDGDPFAEQPKKKKKPKKTKKKKT